MKPYLLILFSSLIVFLMSACQSEEEQAGGKSPAKADSAEGKGEAGPKKNEPVPSGDKAFVGLELKAAETLATERELGHRVVMLDGKPLPATSDYRPDRVNFEVEKGIVVKVSRG